MRFKDKVTVVAGGASGIGRATALAAAREGSKVVIADISSESASNVVAEIRSGGGDCISVIGDASKLTFARQVAQTALQNYGGIHYLCNSVGIQTYGTVESTDEETWQRTFDVNLKSVYTMSKYCIPEIRKNGKGAIVNISSVQGLRCQKNVSAYAASKGAVIAMTRSMALDYAPEKIRVNCICPGSIDTPMLRWGAGEHGPVEEVLKAWGDAHPIGRVGKPEEIASLVLFLFSDEAGFVLGQSFIADGGLTTGIL